MNMGNNAARPLALLIRRSTRETSVCKSCLLRQYSASTTAATDSFRVQAGVVLSRPPQVTRDLTAFEKAFYFYQRRLNERLVLPFTRYFYFKRDTPAELEWKRKIAQRLAPARDIGKYSAYGDTAWNDEVVVGVKESEPETQLESILKDAEVPKIGSIGSTEEVETIKDAVEMPAPRITEADKNGDEKSLDRKLDRTLYLLVKGKEGRWTFPASTLEGKENLHQAAERVLVQAGGINMNTWVVGHAPIGHYDFQYRSPLLIEEKGIKELREKIFFMKARIMAGQANLKGNKLDLEDFKWLAKDEIWRIVTARYWKYIKNMLVEQ